MSLRWVLFQDLTKSKRKQRVFWCWGRARLPGATDWLSGIKRLCFSSAYCWSLEITLVGRFQATQVEWSPAMLGEGVGVGRGNSTLSRLPLWCPAGPDLFVLQVPHGFILKSKVHSSGQAVGFLLKRDCRGSRSEELRRTVLREEKAKKGAGHGCISLAFTSGWFIFLCPWTQRMTTL